MYTFFKLSMVTVMEPRLANPLPYQPRPPGSYLSRYHAFLWSTTGLKTGSIHESCITALVSGRVVIPSQLTSVGL